jgi:aminopeptidase YwaD
MRLSIILLLLTGYTTLSAQKSFEKTYTNLRAEFSADNAYTTTGFVEQRWRLAGNRGFDESIFYVEEILKQAGYKNETNGEADGPFTYRIEKRKMKRPTWEPIDASLICNGETLLQFSTNRNMIAINSASANVTTEVIDVGKGKKEDFEGKDIKGKIVFAEAGANGLYTQAIERGAVGVLAYAIPKYNQPTKHVNSIQFQSIRYTDGTSQKWALMLSYQAKEKLKAALAKGKVSVTANITTKFYEADELTIVANVRGNRKPDERFVFSAHVQEPGANDNATGVATLAEMARTTAALIQQGKFTPQRTMTFLWGDEIISTKRYITDDAKRAEGIKWGLSLDMVGEDITKTGGTFLIEKMPDPSAIWTRGEEKHSEWGGEVLKESQLFPHYFNDLLLSRCLQQAESNGWVVKTNPFEGGSDHTPFLEAKIPGLLMWHFTDVFYHTDGDRLEMVSAEEMKNVGVSALATAYVLSAPVESDVIVLIEEVKSNALKRLETEFALSKEVIEKSGKLEDEQHILDVWTQYYISALDKMAEINIGTSTQVIDDKIAEGKKEIKQKLSSLTAQLKER